MSLIKGIAGKRLNEGKDLTGHLSRESIFLSSGNKVAPFLLHNLRDFLAHCLAEDVSLPEGVASQSLHNK
ncbi:hypothetical protein ES703_53848 [subsurface metagenome]